ncbi:MAG: amidohydrolase family protein [Flavobacteriaceae bacterium]|nr:amidohydrolase family protein [Flavobacteriaceae bacterium]
MKKIITLFLLLQTMVFSAQEYFPKNDGVKTTNSNYTAFTNAKIYVSPTQIIRGGTLLIQNGKVIGTGNKISIPKNSLIIDLKGKTIYPSFIDVYSNFGIEVPKSGSRSFQSPQYDSKRKGYYWNEHIMPEVDALNKFKYNNNKAKELIDAGFGVVNTHNQDGIVRGSGVLVALNSDSDNGVRILSDRSAQYLSFQRSKILKQVYPTSLMGSMALLRQMYYDADWYAKGNSKTKDLSLEALIKNKTLVQIFDAGNKGNALRADGIGDNFGINYTILGGGDEYELIDQIKRSNATYILPINFPKAFDVENPYYAQYITLSDMRDWNQAPSNPSALQNNGISFALTTHKLKSVKDFKSKVLKAITYGLSKETALASLTTIPAKILNKSNSIGSLKNGAYANFLITSGDIFEKKTILYENWVQGNKYIINNIDAKDIRGNYTLNIANQKYKVKITGTVGKPKVSIKQDTLKVTSKFTYKNNWVNIYLQPNKDKSEFIRLVGKLNKQNNIAGKATLVNGNETTWTASKLSDDKDKKKDKEKSKSLPYLVPVTFPNIAYGFTEKPVQEDLLFKNITVWTNEEEGILKNTDVLIKDGKIAKISNGLKAGKAKVIDGTGKHLTSGIIDEHSHIASISTNEAGQNSTAEVSMEDVINFEDVNIYRDLAGGVTESQILHGSANPIGGRSAIIKLKWGETPENMIDKNAPKFIKFALGENVKQSRYPFGTNRFPQSRMGVEQVYTDYFQRAKEYDAIKKSGKAYRKDIEMDVISEILNKETFISCHSYVQSEINMLMKVAEKFNFNINTFTHILEGYKVADKMKAHGVGGSTFSDWWAYKYEVNDAIPYNAAIMHSQGVVTAINSDNAEMSRRLNQEAAKSVKYGGVSEEEAWKFVTLNPAKLLHIDNKVGSIKVGKDADIVLWSDNPLSINAKAEKTIIEGIVYFDMERDLQIRKAIKIERNKLTNLMLKEKSAGKSTQSPRKKETRLNHCDTVEF